MKRVFALPVCCSDHAGGEPTDFTKGDCTWLNAKPPATRLNSVGKVPHVANILFGSVYTMTPTWPVDRTAQSRHKHNRRISDCL